jgi:hypothetical protein
MAMWLDRYPTVDQWKKGTPEQRRANLIGANVYAGIHEM